MVVTLLLFKEKFTFKRPVRKDIQLQLNLMAVAEVPRVLSTNPNGMSSIVTK